jgi:DNA-binding response OmpR family regulator
MPEAKILIIEDDRNILAANRQLLELSGYEVFTAGTLAEGKSLAEKMKPDLVVLDILLPDGNGLDLCRELREAGNVRILILSALGTKQDIIEGLRQGGDDYLAKPYMTEELLLRIAALLRRGAAPASPAQVVMTGPIEWHPSSRQAFIGGTDLLLKPLEYSVLNLLCANRDRYLPPEEIYRACWNIDQYQNLANVHNQIYNLRGKLEVYGIRICLRRGRGYRVEW